MVGYSVVKVQTRIFVLSLINIQKPPHFPQKNFHTLLWGNIANQYVGIKSWQTLYIVVKYLCSWFLCAARKGIVVYPHCTRCYFFKLSVVLLCLLAGILLAFLFLWEKSPYSENDICLLIADARPVFYRRYVILAFFIAQNTARCLE